MDKIPQENEEQEETQTPESALWIQFAGVGSAIFTIQQVGSVSATQIFAVLELLKFQAQKSMEDEWQQKTIKTPNIEQTQQILRP